MWRLAMACLVSIWATELAASCAGSDLRASLSPDARHEIAAAVAGEPFAEGNFWQATRGERDIILVGTVHVDDPRLDAVAGALETDIGTAEVVYLEMTRSERDALQARLLSDPERIVLPDVSLIDLLPEDRWEALAAAAKARGLPPAMTARLQPWYLSLVLALPPCLLANGTVPDGLDARLEAMATKAGVPRRALEPYDTLFTLFADTPLETQIDMLAATVLDPQASEDMLATTLALYFEEAHAELWHLARIVARADLGLTTAEVDAMFADLRDVLLAERNRHWLRVIDRAPERRILAAFGAAHLFGADGILQGLESAGYRVTRLAR